MDGFADGSPQWCRRRSRIAVARTSSPVDLVLSTRNDLEPPVQAHPLTRADAQLLRDPGPGLREIELHPLVVDADPVLLDQAPVVMRLRENGQGCSPFPTQLPSATGYPRRIARPIVRKLRRGRFRSQSYDEAPG